MGASIRIAAAVFLIAALVFACGGDDDDSGPDDGLDDDTGDDDDDADELPPAAPYVEQPLSPTYVDRARILGYTEPGATVVVEGGRDGRVTEPADPANGAFCFQIRLTPDEVNDLSVTAVDAAGNESEPTEISVEHLPTEEPTNIVFERPATASSTDEFNEERSPDKAVDGDEETFWSASPRFRQPNGQGNPQWLKIDLGRYMRFDEVRIVWSDAVDEQRHATSYALRYSIDEFNTQAPNEAAWITFWNTEAGNGGVDEVVLAEPVGSYWFGVLLYLSEDIQGNVYDIAEVEVNGFPYSLAELCE